eukprot:1162102-Pelagomonas_calceolata.AAC.2
MEAVEWDADICVLAACGEPKMLSYCASCTQPGVSGHGGRRAGRRYCGSCLREAQDGEGFMAEARGSGH